MYLPWNDSICINSSSRPPGYTEGPIPYAPSKVVLSDVLIGLQSLNIAVCVTSYWWFRKSTEHTRLRSISIVLMLAAMCLCHLVAGLLNLSFPAQMPCSLYLFACFLIVPFGAGAIIAKFSIFLLLSKYTYMMHIARQDLDPLVTSASSEEDQEGGVAPHLALMLLCSRERTTAQERARMLAWLKFFLQPSGYLLIVSVVMIPFIIMGFILFTRDPAIFGGCVGCGIFDQTILLVLCISGGVVVFIAAAFGWFVRSLPDKWGLGKETRQVVVFAFVAFVGFILNTFIPLYDATFDFELVMVVGFGAMLFVSSIWQLKIGRDKQLALQALHGTHPHKRRNKDSVEASSLNVSRSAAPGSPTMEKLKLNDVLGDNELVKKFEDFLVQELGVESLFFIQDVARWKAAYYDTSPPTRSQRARKIVTTYIDTSGSYGVNLPGDVHADIMKFVREKSDVPLTAFDVAVEEIKQLLTMGALQRFAQAQRIEANATSSSAGAVVPSSP